MAVNKNFVVKNGLEVKSNLLVADTSLDSVGIGTSFIKEKLHVMGGIGATTLFVGGIGTVHVATGTTARYENINITGLGTIATLSSNAVNAVSINASGMVTASKFYGDGSTLTGVSVGVRTAGAVLGYGVTFLDIRGSGVSTAYFNTNVGIATLNFEGGGSGGSVSISSAAPTNPSNGDLWYSIDYGRTFVYYDEVELGVGSTSVWVDASPFNNGGQFIGAYGGTAYGAIGYTAGTASSTSIYFTGDPNTGVYQPTADQLSISAGGVGVATFNPGGFFVGGAATVTSDLSVSGNLNITGDLVYDEERAANSLVSGVSTTGGLNVLGISSVKDLNVVGVATIATLNATTVTPQNLTLQTGVTTNATNTQLRVTGITTLTDAKVLTGVTTNATATNLTVTGITTLASATITATSLTAATGVTTNATNTLLKVTGVSTFASAATFSDDVTFTGAAANVTWDKSVDDLIFGDNAKAAFGAASDLTVYHDASHSYISDQGTGSLKVLSSDFQVNNAANAENMITASEDGAAALYYNGTSRIQTTNTGVNVTGTTTDDGATHDGDVTFTGANYNVTWDKSADDLIFADNAQAHFGTGSDLKIYHDGSNSYIQHIGTGNLYIAGSGETLATFVDDGAVTLYHNNTARFNTHADGVEITGKLYMADDKNIELGTSQDLKIYHDGSNSRIKDSGTGALKLSGSEVAIENAATNETMAQFVENAGVSLRYDNTERFQTKGDGINVTGNVDCDSLNNAGISTFTGDATFGGGAGAITIAGASDIQFTTGTWTGSACKIQHHSDKLYICGGSDGIKFREGANDRWTIDGSGHFVPDTDSTYNIGENAKRVSNVYADNYYGSGTNLTGVGESIGPWYYNPEVNDSLVNLNVGIGITFSKKILPGSSGTATLKIVNAGTAGTTIQSWGISSFTQPAVTEMVLGALVSPLAINQTYQLDIPSGFVVDTNDTAYAGTAYTFATRPINNQLYTFGSNELGQLGQGDTISRSSPVQVLGNNWVDAKSTPDQTRAWAIATNNGTLWTLGYNTFGNLGHNDRNQRSSPTQIPGTTWAQVGATRRAFLATKTDGTLWAWGNNDRGGLGLNEGTNAHKSSPVQIPGTNWWTSSYHGLTQHIGSFALKTNGTLWAWGSNEYGALGLNNKIEYSSPVQIPGTNWDGIYANGANDHAAIFATKTDGTGWAWGGNTVGQLGLNGPVGDNKLISSPTQIPGTNWLRFSSNAYSRTGYGIKTNGTLWVWGRGHYGQLGLSQSGNIAISSPTQLPGTTWKDIHGEHGGVTVAVKTDGTLWSWGFNQAGGGGHNTSGPSLKYSSPVQVGTDTDWVHAKHGDEATYAFKEL